MPAVQNVNYRYVFHRTLDNSYMGEFIVKNVKFNSPVRGPGGQFSGVIPINNDQTVELVKPATALDEVAVYVIYKDPDTTTETFLWGGPIFAREWDSSTREIQITAAEWKSWFYTRMFAPSITAPYADRLTTYTAQDQLVIARALLTEAVTGFGTPTLTLNSETSTRTRDLTLKGSNYKVIGDLIDSMAERTDGFDWAINIRKNVSTRYPELVANLYYPERGGTSGLNLDYTVSNLDRTPDGRGTIQSIGKWPENAAQRRTRIWATGDGQPPDQPVAMDDDPEIDTDTVLLREAQINISGVTSPATLSEHAQAERAILGVNTETIDIEVKTAYIKPTSVNPGDRTGLIIRDDWLDIQETAVRIIDRAIAPHGDTGQIIVLTLDLSDLNRPDLDEGDTV